ncbi:portal protein, partial [Laribacter hongkongensis]
MDGPSIHKQVSARWEALKKERSSWMSHWSEISDYLLPRSGRFFVEDRNKGNKRHKNIYDNTGTRALRVLAAGMMAGMTSPA